MTSIGGLSVTARIANASISYMKYIVKMFWPSRLAIFYPHPGNKVVMWHGVICAAALLVISVFAVLLARKHRYLLSGWLWYLGALIPVIGLVQVGPQAMADRYTYLPSIGISIIVTWGATELVGKQRFLRVCLGVLAGLALVAMLICTRAQVRHWVNSINLFEHAIVAVPNNHIAYNFLGRALERQGRLDEAAAQFNESIRINPYNVDTKNELARILLKQDKNEQVVEMYEQFLPKLPDDTNTPDVFGILPAKQLKFFKDVRDYTEAHAHLGMALLKQGKVDEAIRHFEEVLKFRPDFVDSHKELGHTLMQQNKLEQAVRVYRKVLQIQPDEPIVLNALGIALGKQGKLDEAIECFNKVLLIEPDSAEAHNNLKYAQSLRDSLNKEK
jgi:Flp pilus assembly protein TadD